MATDYVEQLLSSIDIIAEAKAKEQSYDTTVIATVIDASDAKNGRYIVKDNEVTFEAFSENTKYHENDMVRVQIINGDWSQKKFILGKYVQDDNNPTIYVSPLDTIFDMTGNLISDNIKTGLNANGVQEKICLWSANLEESNFADIQHNSIYDTLFLSADIQCLLSDYEIREGDYGLRIEMVTEEDNHYTENFTNLEMFGNSYSFSIFSKQEKCFDITSLSNIKAISLYLYQDKNFKYLKENGELTTVPVSDLQNYTNISVDNLILGFGYNLAKIQDNTVQLYTQESNEYSEDNKTAKTIYLLWYNKDNSNNKYIGFSDGKNSTVDFGAEKNKVYDEIKYQELFAENNRLIAQKTKAPLDLLGLSTGIARDESEKYQKIICHYFEHDLINYLTNCSKSLPNSVNLQKMFENYILVVSRTITQNKTIYSNYYKIATQILSRLNQEYKKYKLKEDLKDVQEIILPSQNVQDNKLWIKNPTDKNGWEDLLIQLEDILNKFSTETDKAEFSSDKSTYLSYAPTFKRIIQKIRDNIKAFEDSLIILKTKTLTAQLNLYREDSQNNKVAQENYFDIEYQEKDLSNYDNHYSIYWYKKAKELQEKIDPITGTGEWIRLTDYDNHGLPSAGENGFFSKKPSAEESSISFFPEAEDSETLKVILFFNHNRYESNEFVLINTSHYVDEEAIDRAKALSISHKKYSRDYYNLYDENNTIINASESALVRTIEASFKGVSRGNEALKGASIYWYIPLKKTMITVDEVKLKDTSKFIIENSEKKDIYHIEGYKYFSKTLENPQDINSDEREFYYSIKQQYNKALSNNTIKCAVYIEGIKYLAEINLLFSNSNKGSANNNLVIIPSTAQQAVGTKHPLLLNMTLYDYSGNEIPMRYGQGGEAEPGDARNTQVEWADNWQPKEIKNFNPKKLNETSNILIGGTIESAIPSASSALVNYGVLKVLTYSKVNNDKSSQITSYYPVAFCLDENDHSYYIEGASTVIYDSTGTHPSYFKGPYRLFNNQTATEVSAKWRMIYLVKVFDEQQYYIVERVSENNYTFFKSYQDLISNNKVDMDLSAEIVAQYEKNFNQSPKLSTDKATLIPPNIYFTSKDSENDFHCVVIAYDSEHPSKVYWTQSLYALQSKDNLATLNDWDGQTQINKAGNRILSAMLVAGRKSSNNNFEGVLLGDVGAETGPNALSTGIGLYGYADGIQTFGINTDGTAYLGVGAGRIEANGKYGIIKGGNWNGHIDSDGNLVPGDQGMAIYLATGHIDAHDFKLTSDFINIDSINQIFKVGYDEQNKIDFQIDDKTKKAILKMKVSEFVIEAKKDLKELTIDSTKNTFIIQNSNESYIKFLKGNLDIKAKSLVVNAKNLTIDSENSNLMVNNNGVNINSGNGTVQLGNSDTSEGASDYLKFNKEDGTLQLTSKNFLLTSTNLILKSNKDESLFQLGESSSPSHFLYNGRKQTLSIKTSNFNLKSESTNSIIAINNNPSRGECYFQIKHKNKNEKEVEEISFTDAGIVINAKSIAIGGTGIKDYVGMTDDEFVGKLITTGPGIYITEENGKKVLGINADAIVTGKITSTAKKNEDPVFVIDLNGQSITSENFTINKSGATFTGVVKALSGKIGNIELVGIQGNAGGYIKISGGGGYTYIGSPNDSLYNKYMFLAGPKPISSAQDTDFPLRMTPTGKLYATESNIAGWRMFSVEPSSKNHTLNHGGYKWNNGQGWHSLLFDDNIALPNSDKKEKKRIIIDPSREVIFAVDVQDSHWINSNDPDFRYCAFGIKYNGDLIFNGVTYHMENGTFKEVGNLTL